MNSKPASAPFTEGLDPAWYDAIPERLSRRRFDGSAVAPEALGRLAAMCQTFHPMPRARMALVEDAPPGLFTGFIGSYGSVRGARSAALFMGTEGGEPDMGYTGEALVLEATRLGVGTCWVAGAFDRKRAATLVDLRDGEQVMAITPLGHATGRLGTTEKAMRGMAGAHKRKTLAEIAAGASPDTWPAWAMTAAEAVRLAPSGVNAQPWRLRFDDDALVLSQAPSMYWTAPMDMGIAMLHAQLGALHDGVRGTWTMTVSAPDVARFTPEVIA